MAIIYSYPPISSGEVQPNDRLVISQMDKAGNPTRSLTIDNLIAYLGSITIGVDSVGLSMPSAFNVSGSPVTSSGVLSVSGAGTSAQYVDGTGALQTFPTIPTGGPFLPLTAGDTVPLTGDLYLAATGLGPSVGSNSIVFTGVDDNGNKVDGAKIFTTDSTINPSGQDLYIQTASDAGTLGTNIFVDAFGFVGLGTTNPLSNLHVAQDTTIGTELNVGQSLTLTDYGSGTRIDTPAYNLAVNASGKVVETTVSSGGGSGIASEIDFTTANGYRIRIYMENITLGSPDEGQAFAAPQQIIFQRQSSSVSNQGGLPWNLFYNQYTPSLDPGYDAASGCGSANMCLKPMMEESVADINLLNSGSVNPDFSWAIFTQDAAALSSYRMPLKMRVDNGGSSPGNGTLKLKLIDGSNNSPSAADETALPSTVSVYFRDTTLTSSKVGGPPFNLLWAGADTQFAKQQNAGAAYTLGLDYVFTGNSAGDIIRKYELFFQDEINSYNRCSYLKVTDGRVVFQDLPTSDPVSKGVLWDDAGTLKISQG